MYTAARSPLCISDSASCSPTSRSVESVVVVAAAVCGTVMASALSTLRDGRCCGVPRCCCFGQPLIGRCAGAVSYSLLSQVSRCHPLVLSDTQSTLGQPLVNRQSTTTPSQTKASHLARPPSPQAPDSHFPALCPQTRHRWQPGSRRSGLWACVLVCGSLCRRVGGFGGKRALLLAAPGSTCITPTPTSESGSNPARIVQLPAGTATTAARRRNAKAPHLGSVRGGRAAPPTQARASSSAPPCPG